MPKIVSIGTALPEYEIKQGVAKEFSKIMFQDHFKNIDRLLSIFENTQIKKRHFCVPIEWFNEEHSFEEKNEIYIKNAVQLAKKAIINALMQTTIKMGEINHIYYVSSTGLSTPSIDARLFNEDELPFDSNIKRTPIWGLGCAGGAAGLSRAFEYTLAYPNHIAIVVALEIGELAFMKNDMSKSNLIATSLFGDGAAAVIVAGDKVASDYVKNGVEILGSHSTIWKDSLDVMGWDVKNNGLKVIFSKDIPSIITNKLYPSLIQFLDKYHLDISNINHFVLHPGGTKVIEAYKQVFQIGDNQLFYTKEVLSEYGNMSSPTVLFVLHEYLKSTQSGYGLLLALGPGFSAEAILLKWE